MLGESKSSYFKSHCKALSHEFGFPDISHLIQAILKLSHELGHRRLFSATAVSWRPMVTCIWRSGYKNAKQKSNSFDRNQTHMCRVTRYFFLSFRCKWNIFQPVNCGELLADMIERRDVYHRAIVWIAIENYEWPFSSPLSSNQFAFLPHTCKNTHCSYFAPFYYLVCQKELFVKVRKRKWSKPHLIWKAGVLEADEVYSGLSWMSDLSLVWG